MDTQDWIPPQNRLADVDASTAEPEDAAKWALYSKVVQGILVIAISQIVLKTLNIVLAPDLAAQIAEAVVSVVGLGFGAALVLYGRAKAAVRIYWRPRTRVEKLARITGLAAIAERA